MYSVVKRPENRVVVGINQTTIGINDVEPSQGSITDIQLQIPGDPSITLEPRGRN